MKNKNKQSKENTTSSFISNTPKIDFCQICQREIKESDFFGDDRELKTCQNCWQKEQVKTKQVNQQNN